MVRPPCILEELRGVRGGQLYNAIGLFLSALLSAFGRKMNAEILFAEC